MLQDNKGEKNMNKFTVIGFIEKTGQIACHHVIANNSMHAFAVVAECGQLI